MDSISQNLQDQISELLKPRKVCLVLPVVLKPVYQPCGRVTSRFVPPDHDLLCNMCPSTKKDHDTAMSYEGCVTVVLSLWRGYIVAAKQTPRCVQVESAFSYLEICSINIHSHTQIVLETDRQTLSFSVSHTEDLEAMVHHMATSLKRIFPDSSPGKLLKMIPLDLQQRLVTMTDAIEDQLNNQPGSCGGFSDTYAALCDFNDMPFREEIQWDVDNIYHSHNLKQFNLQDFSHLDSSDMALAVAALSFNPWFTKIYCKELKLSVDVQQQLTFLLSRTPSLEELSLEDAGLKLDFALKIAAALKEHTSSTLRSINLSGNPIEDKGIVALSQELRNLAGGLMHLSLSRVSLTAKGLGCLSRLLSSNQLLSTSLTHLDLSANPNSLVTEESTLFFRFLSTTNSLSHLDLSDTNCPLDTLFVSLSSGCCYKLMHLDLARNPFSHRKVRGVTRSIREFFSQSCNLKYVGLSATKLPPQALRLLLQGLATNSHLTGLEVDLSSCELRSEGAQVIQEHISEATAISSLDISDNGFENNMVTLVLSLGRCHSLQRLALGGNFAMKSRALTDVLHRIAQLIQDEECPLRSLSVCDSNLKTGMHILLSALGGHAALAELDISGNNIGDTGAKMLAKALMMNTSLRTLTWDRNNITARGFQDVADALERNFTLQQVSLPLADITQSYRHNNDRTKEALHKIQQCLDRNNQRQFDRVEVKRVLMTQQSEKLVQGMSRQLKDRLQNLNDCSNQELRDFALTAQDVLHNARESFKLLPSLYEAGRTCASDDDLVYSTLNDAAATITNKFMQSIQEMAQDLMRSAESVCPRTVQRSSVCECLSECVSKRTRQTHTFLRNTLVENTGKIIVSRLIELRQTLCVSYAESIIEQVRQDLKMAQDKMDCLLKENPCKAQTLSVPELHLVDCDFPTDDYSPAIWRDSSNSKSLRPASSIKSLQDADWERQARDREAEGGRGEDAKEKREGRCILPQLPKATPLSVTVTCSSPSTSPAPSPPGGRDRERREGVVMGDAAAAISGERGALIPPSSLPLPYSISTQSPEEETAGCRGLTGRQAPFPGGGPSLGLLPGSGSTASPMEPLPIKGQTLRHYTASRPRPRRTHTQPPSSRPPEPVSKESEASGGMGRVDEGVEEFFTKKILPSLKPETLGSARKTLPDKKGRWEESNSAQATPSESSLTPSASIPFSTPSNNITPSAITTTVTSPSAPCSNTSLTSTDIPLPSISSITPTTSSVTNTTTVPTKNIKKKFGNLFAFKRSWAARATKTGSLEGGGGGEGVKVKRNSIADLIRPLREVKERERDRERDKVRGAQSVKNANVSNDDVTKEGTITTSRVLAPVNTLTTTMTPCETTSSDLTIPMSPDHITDTHTNLEEEVLSVLPGHTPSHSPGIASPLTEQERSDVLMKDTKLGRSPCGERRLKTSKRSLREGKSQSLILLTRLEPEDRDKAQNKKHTSENSSSFEQRLQVMLQRIGVAKTAPADTKTSNKDEELRKANSEGTILDKPQPPPIYLKPRTMSTSSAEPRHPIRAQEPIPPDPPLHQKPTLPEHPSGHPLIKPPITAKPPILTASGTSSAERVHSRTHPHDGRPGERTSQNGSTEGPQGEASVPSPRRALLPTPPSPWKGPSAQDRSEKAQSATDESLPKLRQHVTLLPQRRAVSVHEDTLAMTQELKAVLQRSPLCHWGNRGDRPTCSEHPLCREEAQRVQRGDKANDTGRETAEEKERALPREEMKADRNGGTVAEASVPSLVQEEVQGSELSSSPARFLSLVGVQDKAPSKLERPTSLNQMSDKSLVTPTPPTTSLSTAPAQAQASKKLLVPPPLQTKTPSTTPAASEPVENPYASPASHKKKSPGTTPVDLGYSTKGGDESVFKQHKQETKTADQRTQSHVSK